MLEELWHWLRIDVSGVARQLGFQREGAALRARHRRCASAWQPHLENTRQCLLRSARLSTGAATPSGRAVLLGAGLLRDIPLSGLLPIFQEIVLADVAFHPDARAAQQRSKGKVQLVPIDVSECLEALNAGVGRPRLREADPDSPLSELLRQSQWVASVNLLTQLPLLPCAWLRRHGRNGAHIESFALAVMDHHLRILSQAPEAVCIVTEQADWVRDTHGEVVEHVSRTAFLSERLATPPWQVLESWEWLVNPPGELSGHQTEIRQMVAMHRGPGRAATAGRARQDSAAISIAAKDPGKY